MSGASRPSKRIRKLSTDSEGTEESYDWADRRRSGAAKAEQPTTPKKNDDRTSRSRRTASGNVSSATVSRGPPTAQSKSPESMRLTVKTSSNKLREATRTSTSMAGGTKIAVNSRDQFVGGEIINGKRARNVKKSYVLESDSEEEDEEMADVVDDEDAEGESVEDDEEEEDDDALGDEDADGDIDMDIPPPPPVIKISKAANGKQTLVVKPAAKSDTVTVEQKEADLGSDDEELSELDSDLDEVEEEEAMQEGDEEDAEEEEEEIEVEGEVDEDEEELDSDDETPGGGSRASTPDMKNLTKRQRARFDDEGSGHLMALPDEVQVKKHLTAEEHAMRRAEMARRRKNLSEKRNEEEKMETINKLLKKQAPKTNARRSLFAGPGDASTPDSNGVYKPNPIFVRWVSNKDGNRIGVPTEWVEGGVGVGDLFGGVTVKQDAGLGGKLIREVS